MLSSTQPVSTPTTEKLNRLNILWAFDGSEHAMAALRLLEDLHVERIDVTALCVMPTQYFEAHRIMQAGLDEAEGRLKSRGFQVKTILKTGSPAATINEFAQESQSDLILIGAKGLRATLGILLGGVAQQVVEYLTRPVLVARAPYRGLKKLLVVIDGSSYSQRALEYLAPRSPSLSESGGAPAAAFTHCAWLPAGAELTVMLVLPPPLWVDPASQAWALGTEALVVSPPVLADMEALEAEERQKATPILARAEELLEKAGFHTHTEMRQGDAATEILAFAREHEVDLIVCGSRGLNPVSDWLVGSVSRKLVHYAGCSVLIVK